jgi:4'-phosphopantetheinyl transferase
VPDTYDVESRSLPILLCIALDRISPDEVDVLSLLVGAADRAHAQRMRRPMDRLRTLAGRALLRYGMSTFFGLKAIETARDEHGRPFLSGHPTLDFNISHSGDWAVCLIGDHRVGVDVERIGPFHSDVVGFFAKSESELLARIEPEKRTEAFYRIWTAKEAYVKASGETFRTPLHQFWFSFTGAEIALTHEDAADTARRHFFSGMLDADHRYTCCYSGMETKPKVRVVTMVDLSA